MDGSISFAGTSLQTYNRQTRVGISTDHIDLDSLADRVLSAYALAHGNSTTIASINTPQRIIPVTGTVIAATPTALDTALDTFRGLMSGKNQTLSIVYGGTTRVWTATVSALSITRSEDKKYATFSAQFLCVNPFGVSANSIYILNVAGRTNASYTDSFNFIGSAPFQLPVTNIIIGAVSSTGSQSITWGNGDNGQAITVARNNWTAGDILTIDASNPLNQTVKVNGIDADFSGAFPEFTPGNHSISYSDTFTSRTISEVVTYNPRYA